MKRTLSLFLTMGLMVVHPMGVFGQTERGDMTGDGVIDGKDALKIMRIVEGWITATETDSLLGDVYPLPGVGDRIVGDGQLTREDAERILRMAVGLIGRGGVTGAFGPPQITDFTPSHGPVGTQVILKGINFVPAKVGDNPMYFGAVQAEVLSVTDTELEVEVPEGATTGPIMVMGPGGTGSSPFDFTVTVERRGKLAAPAGMSAKDYVVVNKFLEEVEPEEDGSFSVSTDGRGVTTHIGVPKDGSDRILLSLDVIGEGGVAKAVAEPSEMDMLSTAQSLVFLAPHLVSLTPERAQVARAYIRDDPKVVELAEVLAEVYKESSDPSSDPRYREAYEAAIRSVLDRLPEDLTADFETPAARVAPPARKPAREAREEEEVRLTHVAFYPDGEVTSAGRSKVPGLIPPEGVYGNPVDWVVHLAEVEDIYETFPNGMGDIREMDPFRVLPRSGKESMAFISSESALTSLDWFGNLFSKGWDGVTGWLADRTGTTGIATPDNHLHVAPDRDGVYVVRAISGLFYDIRGTGENDFIDDLPDGTGDWQMALVMNAAMAGADFVGAWLGKGALSVAGVDVKAALRKSIRVALRKATRVALRRSPRGAAGFTRTTEFVKAFLSLLHSFAADFLTTLLGEIPGMIADPLEARAATTLGKGAAAGLKLVGSAIDIGYKTAMFGSCAERVAVLALGWHPLLEVTPLETWVVVVGDPFNPRIDSFSPTRGSVGRIVTIKGQRFAERPEDNSVRFGLDVEAEIVSGNAKELKVKVPDLPTGTRARILVLTPRGRMDTEELFTVLRSPYITSIEPEMGYAYNPSAFGGEGFEGTWVRVLGEDFDPNADPGDQVAFSGTYLLLEEVAVQRFENYYQAYVPPEPYSFPPEPVQRPGYTGKRVYVTVKAWEEKERIVGVKEYEEYISNRAPFVVLGPPTLESITPPEAKGGEWLSLLGTNFSPNEGELRVHLKYGGKDHVFDSGDIEWHNYGLIRLVVPGEVPEDTEVLVQVETPAGISRAQSFTRGKGLAPGYTITITSDKPGRQADGELTLDEAVAFAGGLENPYGHPWDDGDEKIFQTYREIKTDKGAYDWVEGDVSALWSPGHSGYEVKYTYRVNQYHADHGGGRDTTLVDREPLDSGVDEAHMPEEGDYVQGERGGKDNMDMLRTGLGELTLHSGESLELNGDKLYLHGAGITLHLDYPMVLHNDCEVWVDTVTASGIVIKGNNNSIRGNFYRCEGDGVRIDGGQGNNVIGYTFVDNKGAGVDLRNGAKGNAISGGEFRGNKVGVYIHGQGTDVNTISGSIKKSTDEGVIISDGARFNIINASVDSSGADGVLITGQGTDGNKIMGDLTANKGNGVHITDGAQGNEVHGRVDRNGKNGILIEGGGTDHNKIKIGWIVQNAEAGIKVVGSSGGGSPFGTIVDVGGLIDNQSAGIWLSGVAADLFPATRIRTGIRGSLVGIRLDRGTQNVLIEPKDSPTTVDSCQVGVLISGENTAFNTVGAGPSQGFIIKNFSQAGVHITDGAYENILKHLFIVRGERVGFLLDKGAHHNQLLGSEVYEGVSGGDGMVIEGYDNIVENGRFSGNTNAGLVIRNGARGNVFRGIESKNNKIGIIVQGTGVQDNIIEAGSSNDSEETGILITDGATNTTISNMGIRDNGLRNIWITNGAQDVEVFGCDIRHEKQEGKGIVVDGGAKKVRIGRPGDPEKFDSPWGGRNSIVYNEVGILVQGPETEDVRVVYNLIMGNKGHGIVVRDGAKRVVIGGQSGALNVISGNTAGVYAAGAGTGVTILGNTIGEENITGREGVVLDEGIYNVRVLRNLIQRNATNGVRLDNGAHHNTLMGNIIRGNFAQGVMIDNGSHYNTLQGNEITENIRDGILVAGGSLYNTLRGNTITGNVRKGIRLTGGGNNGIPAPVIDEFSVEGQRIQGYVEGSVPKGSTVDVFADTWDEGAVYLGSYLLTSNRFYLKGGVPPGMYLHALVTDPDGNTSEFGPYEPGLVSQIRPSTIAFTSTRDGNSEIYLLRPGSSAPERLTDHSASDYSPRLSPDGKNVLFVSERSGNPDLWVMGLDGSGLMRLTSDPASDYDPAWSRDGKKIAFISERDGNPEVYVMPVDPDLPAGEVSYDDGEAEEEVGLKQEDGIGVYFTAQPGKLFRVMFYIKEDPIPFRWAMMQWDGEHRKPGKVLAEGETTPEGIGWHSVEVEVEVPSEFFVATYARSERAPRFGVDTNEPDWRSLSYNSQQERWSWTVGRDYMIRAEVLPSAQRLTENGATDRYPCWSPDGEWIAFASDRGGDFDLYRMRPDRTEVERLTSDVTAEWAPSWSSSGKWMAFVSRQGTDAEIYKINLETREVVRLTDRVGLDADPVWADGVQVVFISDREGDREIYRMRSDGSGVTPVTVSLGEDFHPDTR